jgi:hypothetical protein
MSYRLQRLTGTDWQLEPSVFDLLASATLHANSMTDCDRCPRRVVEMDATGKKVWAVIAGARCDAAMARFLHTEGCR